MFPGMSEYQFATFIVVAKQDKIKKELKIDCLYTEMAAKLVYEFIINNKINIKNKFSNQYECLFDECFLKDIINLLKKAQKKGVALEILINKI